jgi:hypothetical protein
MNGGEGGCRARAAADMAGGPATGEDATDYDVGIPDELRKSVLFDGKEHCGVKAHVVDQKDRVAKYGKGLSCRWPVQRNSAAQAMPTVGCSSGWLCQPAKGRATAI